MDDGKIHIIDDGSSHEKLIDLLKDSGYHFCISKDVDNAIEEVLKFMPDLIIIDAHIADNKGIALCRSLKKLCKLERVPILFMAVMAYPYVINQAFKAGAQDFIAKPFNPLVTPMRIETHMNLVQSRQNEYEALEREKKAVKKAMQASKVKSEFLAVMSHEIRTPLNAVIGFTDILLGEDMSDNHLDMLSTVKRSSDLLLSLVNDILDITKIEADEMEVEEFPFNLVDAIYDAAEFARSKLSTDDVEVLVDCDIPVEYFKSDATRIRQILTNLMSNAVKFTHKGEVRLKVRSQASEGDKFKVNFEVIDTGIGMTEEQLDIIFEPFRQADSSTTRKYGGTGLGLSISKRLIDLLGGELKASSCKDKGSNFFFTLELNSDTLQPSRNHTFLHGHKALMVDDNPNNRKILTKILKELGVECDSFANHIDFYLNKTSNVYDIAFIDPHVTDDIVRFAESLLREGQCRYCVSMPVNAGAKLSDVFASQLAKPIRPAALASVCHRVFRTQIETSKNQVANKLSEGLEILVAEDNETNQRLITKMLKKIGHNADIVPDGKQAIEAMFLKKYDVVLMDMQMPVMSGLEATEFIRSNIQFDSIPIIALTANAMEHFRDQCLKVGMNDFLTKPINKDKLWKSLEVCTKKSSMIALNAE